MEIKTILLVIQVILGIILIGSILLQVRGSGLGTMFGGGGGEFYRSKRGIEKLLYRTTIIVSILFVANCLAIAYLYAE